MARRRAQFEIPARANPAEAACSLHSVDMASTSMNEGCRALRRSRSRLLHFFKDKNEHSLHLRRASGRLKAVVLEVEALGLDPEPAIRLMIRRSSRYADAQNEHRVLHGDVKFLASKTAPGPGGRAIHVRAWAAAVSANAA